MSMPYHSYLVPKTKYHAHDSQLLEVNINFIGTSLFLQAVLEQLEIYTIGVA